MNVPLDPFRRHILVCRAKAYASDKQHSGELVAAVDTGSTHVMIPPDTARSLGYSLEGAPRARFVTGSGVVYAPRIVLARMEVGRASAEAVEAVCHDLPEECGVDALLGLSFLTRFDVRLDFGAWEMELTPRA